MAEVIDPKQVQRLVTICASLGFEQGKEESDPAFLGRVLPKIVVSLNPDRKMTPMEAIFFEMPATTQRLLFTELGFKSEEAKKKFDDGTPESVAKELAQLYKGAGEDRKILHERMFASQYTVHQLSINQPPFPKHVTKAFKKIYDRNVFKGENPDTVGSEYVPISASILDEKKHVYCVTMARTVLVGTRLNQQLISENVERLQTVHIIVDPSHETAEFRGPVHEKDRAIRTFVNSMKSEVPHFETSNVIFDEEDVDALIEKLGARGRKIRIRNQSGAQSGIGIKTFEMDANYSSDNGDDDLLKSEDWKSEKEKLGEDQVIWDMGVVLEHEGALHTLHISLRSASLRFTEANATDSAIRKVTRLLNDVLREKGKRKKKDKKSKQDPAA